MIELNAEQIAVWEKGCDRYEKMRKMSTQEFHALFLRKLNGEGTFDQLVDSFGED